MKASFISIRNSFLVLVATMSACLTATSRSETVHSETYPMGEGSTFVFSFYASHTDTLQNGSGSNFDVVLTIIVRDAQNNVYSSSLFSAQFNSGEIELSEFEDLGTFFDPIPTEGGSSSNNAELTVYAEFNPPGELENYSVEVVLAKYKQDEADTETVYVTLDP